MSKKKRKKSVSLNEAIDFKDKGKMSSKEADATVSKVATDVRNLMQSGTGGIWKGEFKDKSPTATATKKKGKKKK